MCSARTLDCCLTSSFAQNDLITSDRPIDRFMYHLVSLLYHLFPLSLACFCHFYLICSYFKYLWILNFPAIISTSTSGMRERDRDHAYIKAARIFKTHKQIAFYNVLHCAHRSHLRKQDKDWTTLIYRLSQRDDCHRRVKL